MTVSDLSHDEFRGKLRAAHRDFQDQREKLLDALSKETSVILYSFGNKGRDLAFKLRDIGVSCVIYDNAKHAVESAKAEGFEVTSNLTLPLPLIVAAGQNQLSILSELARPAYSLVEGYYAFDLISAYGRARLFTESTLAALNELFHVYQGLDPSSREEFLSVLLYRASLNVKYIASTRKPVSHMWIPPAAVTAIRSYCDVGAYDGDTLTSMKAAFPTLEYTFAVEPNLDFASKIAAAARNAKLENRIYSGAAWSHKAKLNCRSLSNGMMVITEDTAGAIDADALDNITSLQQYDYVKFDVEGAEAPAISGAQSLLQHARCISVATYHLPMDLTDIPSHIWSILGNESSNSRIWRCAFGHYSECFDDSIYYFFRI